MLFLSPFYVDCKELLKSSKKYWKLKKKCKNLKTKVFVNEEIGTPSDVTYPFEQRKKYFSFWILFFFSLAFFFCFQFNSGVISVGDKITNIQSEYHSKSTICKQI